MNTSHSDTTEYSPAVLLGKHLRRARQAKGLTIAELAEQVGRPREWLNRIELGHSEYGEHRPPSAADLQSLGSYLSGCLEEPLDQLLELGRQAEAEFSAFKTSRVKPLSKGKLTQAEVIVGEDAVVQAIVNLIEDQHSDAVIRNTGIRGLGAYTARTQKWNQYRAALGKFLDENPSAVLKRIEHVENDIYLKDAKESDAHLAGSRKLDEVFNAKVKFRKKNPLSLHLLIGQREAILALPHNSGHPGSNMALLVKDKLFVESLRQWFDEVLWEGPDANVNIDFANFDESFEKVKEMYIDTPTSHSKKYFEEISPSAALVAFYRSFSNIPFAKSLYHKLNFSEADTLSPDLAPRYEARFILTDQLIKSIGATTYLELAAGLSTRGANFASQSEKINYYELDLPHMVQWKKQLLNEILPEKLPNLHFIPKNALQLDELTELRNGDPIVILNEGLLKYLSFSEREKLAVLVKDILQKRGGAWITPDISTDAFYQQAKTVSTLYGYGDSKSNFKSIDEAINFFTRLGFKVEVHPFNSVQSQLSSPQILGMSDQQVAPLLEGSAAFVMTL